MGSSHARFGRARSHARIDLGYPWWLTYGHLPLMAVLIALVIVNFARKRSTWSMVVLCVLAVWSASAFLIQRFVFNINGVPDYQLNDFCSPVPGEC